MTSNLFKFIYIFICISSYSHQAVSFNKFFFKISNLVNCPISENAFNKSVCDCWEPCNPVVYSTFVMNRGPFPNQTKPVSQIWLYYTTKMVTVSRYNSTVQCWAANNFWREIILYTTVGDWRASKLRWYTIFSRYWWITRFFIGSVCARIYRHRWKGNRFDRIRWWKR